MTEHADPFVAWNLCLLRAFFSKASSQDETWLAADADELNALGPQLGGDIGFLEAVSAGPPWNTISPAFHAGQPSLGAALYYTSRGSPRDLAERAVGLLRQRKTPLFRPAGYVDPGDLDPEYAGRNAPGYLPILAALVRASAGQNEDGFYACLQDSLGLRWGPNEMAKVEVLWRDLAQWTVDCDGAFGRFRYAQLGGYRRIGIPRSQSILSQRDAQLLTRVFAQVAYLPGQGISSQLLRDVKSLARDATYLSRAFREALTLDAFADASTHRVRALLEEWDGVVAAPMGDGDESTDRNEIHELGVALVLGEGNAPPWNIRWRVPGIRDRGHMEIAHYNDVWRVQFSGRPMVEADPGHAAITAKLLSSSAAEPVFFDEARVSATGKLEQHGGLRFVLGQKRLRTMIAEYVPTSTGGEALALVERDLPAHGPAYLLAAPANVQTVRTFLSRNFIRAQDCPNEGLPDGWLLLFLSDCAALDDARRNELPDGLVTRSRPRPMRLVGGCQVRRAGLRQFLSYDLPTLELDAPPGTEVSSMGLVLAELERPHHPAIDGRIGSLSSIRHFSILPTSAIAAATEIKAVWDGRVIDMIRLRIAPDDGLGTALRGFTLDTQGRPRDGNTGLRGAILGSTSESASCPDEGDLSTTSPLGSLDTARVGSGPAADFLDALSQKGSMAYGVARDLLNRVLERRGEGAKDVSRIIQSLGARGMLEIETDSKGRWTRVHAAQPVLYTLPARTFTGRVVGCIAGSPRRRQWHDVIDALNGHVKPYLDADPDENLDVLRLSAESSDALRKVAADSGLVFVAEPARLIAKWSAGVAEVRGELQQSGVQSLGVAARSAERFSANTGRFVPSADGVRLYHDLSIQLFRLEDRETGGRHRIFSLGYRDHDESPRYAFVRDWRWGAWAALGAFGTFARDRFNIDDAFPWPFPYSRVHATLWLPARLRLPVVLERAVVLCSGSLPSAEAISREDSDSLLTSMVENVSRAYSGFIGDAAGHRSHAAPAKWLGYRWIPIDVASNVSERLGGRLQYIDD